METLLQSRDHIKASINRVYSFTQSIPEDTLVEALEVRLDRLEEAWKDFSGNQYDLHQYHAEEGYVDPEEEFAKFETKFLTAKSLLLKSLRGKIPARDSVSVKTPGRASNIGIQSANDSFADINNRVSNEQTIARDDAHVLSADVENVPSISSNSKLSEIELPAFKITPFAGDYREWPCFRDMFLGSIDCRKHLSGSQKFRYLKSFLRDEPASLLNGIYISDANYEPAWEKLERRYNRPLYIINQFIETFLNLPSVTSADSGQLRKLVDNADEVVRGLKAMESEGRDPWLIYLLINKTDSETRRAWALMNQNSEVATIHELLDFLKNRCSALETSESKVRVTKTGSRSSNPTGRVKSLSVANITCPKCKGSHPLYQCSDFIALSIEDRRRFARDQRLCYNCLGTQHSSSRCHARSRCSHCRSRHHSLVHLDISGSSRSNNVSDSPNDSALVSSPSPSIVSNHTKPSNPTTGILPTVVVEVLDAAGIPQRCRALLDSGSQVSFVTDRVVRMLGLSRRHSRLPISGISAVDAGVTQGVVNLQLKPRFDTSIMHVEAFVLKTITSITPPLSFDFDGPLLLNDLPLADPGFNTPAPIDILLGSDRVWSSLRDGHRSDGIGNIIAHNTVFGWVIAGNMPKNHVVSLHVGMDIDVLLKSFWEIEEIGSQLPAVGCEDDADKHFEETFSRAPDNKFIVELPFRQGDVRFGNTLSGALSRLFSLERRFSRDANLRAEYCKFMKVYEELGHMERIPDREVEPTSGKAFYLPHHAVVTTKMRVVFNGSHKDSTGLSLNKVLHIGPPLQKN